MLITGKCPGCGTVPGLGINAQGVSIRTVGGSTWKGLIYVCPNVQCQTILGAGIDPVALKTDTINGVVKALGGRR